MNLAKEKKTKIAVFYIIISQRYGTLQILNDPLSSLFQSILANILGFEFKLCAFHLTFWDFSVGPGYMLVEVFKVKLEEIFWTDSWSPLWSCLKALEISVSEIILLSCSVWCLRHTLFKMTKGNYIYQHVFFLWNNFYFLVRLSKVYWLFLLGCYQAKIKTCSYSMVSSLKVHWSDFHLSSLGRVVISFPWRPVDTISIWWVFPMVISTVQIGAMTIVIPPGSFNGNSTVAGPDIIISVFGCECKASMTRKRVSRSS